MTSKRKVGPSFPLDRIVEVTWIDSASNGGWDGVDEYRACGREATRAPLRSIGYLVQHTKTTVQLAQSMSSLYQHVANTISIPAACVKRMRSLK